MSVGRHPEDTLTRAMDDKGAGCSAGVANDDMEFLWTDVDTWGDHALFTNSAGGRDECVHGSYMDSMYEDFDLRGKAYDLFPWHSQVMFAPTFIASSSALNWSRHNDTIGFWRDHWSNIADGPHVHAFPTGGARFLASWITEWHLGKGIAPVCDLPYMQVGWVCRPKDSDEVFGICNNGYCDPSETSTSCPADCHSSP
jgi:hypothetical protein